VTGSPVLELEHIVKRFGRVTALADASLTLYPGTVHALLGENGAGKTTLMRVAYGMEQPDRGVIRIDGVPRRLRAPADAIAAGIGMVHQHFTLVPAMSVAENIALGRRGRFDPTAAAEQVRALGAESGLHLDPHARARDLPVTAQQRLEILKALSRDARVLVLDEPTATLAPQEADDLLAQLRGLADAGRAIVLITHKLREVSGVADAITVLRRGVTTLTTTPSATSEEALVTAMLGQDARRTRVERRPARADAPVVIRAHAVTVTDARGVVRVRDATFSVAAGEIVGVAAVEGSGHRELLRAVAGRAGVSSGTLKRPPSVGFVPDDRHREALVLDMSLTENFALRDAGARRGRMPWRQLDAATSDVLEEFAVRAAGVRAPARTLSGGNQQKFVVARELAGSPAALVAENPTRGLDVGAALDVQRRLVRARDDGVAILVYSADIDEVLALADRMLVVHAGVVRDAPVDREAVGRAMLGAT
jgi:simple sugar transport system ATP-binding protein